MDNKEQYGKPDYMLTPLNPQKCEHILVRKNASEVGCLNCPNGWIDNGRFIIDDGKLTGILELASK